MLKVLVDYPSREEEIKIMQQNMQGNNVVETAPVADPATLKLARSLIKKVYVDEKIQHYILDIVLATRRPDEYKLNNLKPLIGYGASPRASIYLLQAARAMALLQGRAFVVPADVVLMAPDVLRHRIGLTYEAEAEEVDVEYVINQILSRIPAP
jgi:MoxR-like ATPase